MSGHTFSSTKVFITLFILTAVEVGWSFLPIPRWAIWGGLLVFAFWKGFLIFTYFMHMKFEGWVVKALIAPTPLLIAIVLFALMPDVSYNKRLIHPIGNQIDNATGEIVRMDEHDSAHGDGGDHGDDSHGGGGH